MTLPITTILPEVPDFNTLEDANKYIKDLRFELQNNYQNQTQNIDGFFSSSADVDGSQYIPTLEGSTTAGIFTYTRQNGYALRKGIITDVWFEVRWTSSGTAAGQLRLNLPYKQATGQFFFVGVCYMNQATFPVGATTVWILGITGSYQASFQAFGSGTDTSAINVYGSGAVGGHLRYIGVEDE